MESSLVVQLVTSLPTMQEWKLNCNAGDRGSIPGLGSSPEKG